jgi:hypothetical protein
MRRRVLPVALMLCLGATAAVAADRDLVQPPTPQAKAQWAQVYRTADALIAGADLIVTARHVMTQPGRVVGTVPFTYNGFVITSVLKGAAEGTDLVVEEAGSRTGDVRVGIADDDPFVPGKSYLLFLKSQGRNGVYSPLNQARYEVHGNELMGADLEDQVVRVFSGKAISREHARVQSGLD